MNTVSSEATELKIQAIEAAFVADHESVNPGGRVFECVAHTNANSAFRTRRDYFQNVLTT